MEEQNQNTHGQLEEEQMNKVEDKKVVNPFGKVLSQIKQKLPLDKIKLPPKVNEVLNKLPKPLRITLVATVSVLVVMILISLIAVLVRGVPQKEVTPLPVPTPQSKNRFEQDEITNPSAYANDNEILDFKNQVDEINKSLEETDIGYPLLQPPSVDFKIEF